MNLHELKHVKVRPWPLSVLPPMRRAGTALYPNIWVGRELYEDLQRPDPNPYYVALIEHERTHLARMKAMGVARWYAKYAVSKSFRYQEELAGVAAQITYLRAHQGAVDTERFAKLLAGFAYLWPVSKQQARQDIAHIIEQQRERH